jgi:SAM-dependent methyltransferase
LSFRDRLMERTGVYRLFQATHAKAKFRPILEQGDLETARRVLDVGCGPGTNAALFSHTDYLGVDINPSYIEYANRNCPGQFEVADLTTYDVPDEGRFDFILSNSLFHHLDDHSSNRLLEKLSRLLTDDGAVHILDLVMPERLALPRLMAVLDRGEHPRTVPGWERLISAHFAIERFQLYTVGPGPLAVWQMVYCRGVRIR